jgi:hypothetical protein
MLNIPLYALAYVLTPKYYHVSWLSSLAPGGGSKKRPHQDPEVQAGYMKALEKLIRDEEECDNIRRKLSHYILSNGAFGTVIAQVVGWAKSDPTTKASATTWESYTQCHLDVVPALQG